MEHLLQKIVEQNAEGGEDQAYYLAEGMGQQDVSMELEVERRGDGDHAYYLAGGDGVEMGVEIGGDGVEMQLGVEGEVSIYGRHLQS